MEKLENMLLNKVQVLFDEIEYYTDIKEEAEEEILNNNEEMKVFLNLYTEFNRKSIEKVAELRRCEKEFKELIGKQERLSGRISKKDLERKYYLESKIDSLTIEIENDKQNRKDAKESIDEIISQKHSLEESNKIKDIEEKINENKKQLQEIYDNCNDIINNLDNEIKEKQENIKKAVNDNNMELINGLSLELSELLKEKDEVYFKYKDIIKLIENKQILNVKETNKNIELPQEEQEKSEIQRKMSEAARIVAESEKNPYIKPEIIKDDRVFYDELRTDKDHRWMNSANVINTGYASEIIEEPINDNNNIFNNTKNKVEEIIKNHSNVKDSIVNTGKRVLGKIQKISTLKNHFNELIANKINLGAVKVSAGTSELITDELVESESKGR